MHIILYNQPLSEVVVDIATVWMTIRLDIGSTEQSMGISVLFVLVNVCLIPFRNNILRLHRVLYESDSMTDTTHASNCCGKR